MKNITTGNTYLAQVIQVLASQGLVLVRSVQSTIEAKLLSIPNAAGTYGTSSIQCYNVGSIVLVYKNQRFKQDRIIGVAATQSPDAVYTKLNNFGNFPWTTWFSNTLLYQTMIRSARKAAQKGGVDYNATKYNGDLYSGDFCVLDLDGYSKFLVGQRQILLDQGAAQIRLTGVDNKVSTTAHTIQSSTLTTYNKQTPNLSKHLVAAQIAQGLGYKSGSKIFKNAQCQLDTTVQPLFRHQRLEGALVDGAQQSILIAKKSKELYKESANQFAPVYKKHLKYNGQLLEQTATAKRSVKTLNIYSQMQGGYKPVGSLQPSQSQECSVNVALFLQSYYGTDQTLKQYATHQMLLSNPDQLYQLVTDQNICFNTNTIADIIQLKPQIKQPITDTQQYIKPQIKEYTDQATGKTTKYTDLSSIVSQQTDGSIIIKDGWGSQIRMYGGNIYISSALDTFIRPGRDLIQMVPRLRDSQVNGSITMVSKDNIRLGAQNSTCISSGISGNPGITTIQNRSKANSEDSGVVIRSNVDATLTASQDMYIGLNDKTAKNKGQKVQQTKTGSIIIGGSSQLFVNSNTIYMEADTSLDLFGGSSRLNLSNGNIIGIAQKTVLDSWLQISGVSDTELKPQWMATGFKSVGAGFRQLTVQGHLYSQGATISGAIHSNGQILGSQFIALQAQQNQIPALKPQNRADIYRQMEAFSSTQLTQLSHSYLNKPSCYADQFICKNQFKFPDYSKFINCSIIPGMCWQAQSWFKLAGVFQSVLVQSTGDKQQTMPYPGKKIDSDDLKISYYDNIAKQVAFTKCSIGYKVNRSNYKEN